jgi:hypothetical protein
VPYVRWSLSTSSIFSFGTTSSACSLSDPLDDRLPLEVRVTLRVSGGRASLINLYIKIKIKEIKIKIKIKIKVKYKPE